MAKLLCIGDVILNLDLVVSAEWVTTDPPRRSLYLTFAAPTPVEYGPGLQVGTAAHQVSIPESDPAARKVWESLLARCDPPEAVAGFRSRLGVRARG